jgi:hypothetical protein
LFLALVCLLIFAVGCGRLFEAEGQLGASIADVAKCGSSLGAKSAQPLPKEFPVPPQTHAYQHVVDGPTQFWFTTVPGSSNTIVSTRNGIKKTLTGAGYVDIAQDQELGTEADFYFSGRYLGSIQVRPLCHGRIRVRYGFGAGSLGAPTLRHKAPPIIVSRPPGTPTTVPPALVGADCIPVPPPLAQPFASMPPGLSLPPGSYASEDLTPSGGSTHAALFVLPSGVSEFFNYIAKTWPGEGVTITFAQRDPSDSEFAFEFAGQQGSMALTRPFCDPSYSNLVFAYGGADALATAAGGL